MLFCLLNCLYLCLSFIHQLTSSVSWRTHSILVLEHLNESDKLFVEMIEVGFFVECLAVCKHLSTSRKLAFVASVCYVEFSDIVIETANQINKFCHLPLDQTRIIDCIDLVVNE